MKESHGAEAIRRMWDGRYDTPVPDDLPTKAYGPVIVDIGDLAVAYTEVCGKGGDDA